MDLAATASAMTAQAQYGKLTRARGDALVPRDIAAIPMVALMPSSNQKFKYRIFENNFRLIYVAGFRMASEYDSENAKWEELD